MILAINEDIQIAESDMQIIQAKFTTECYIKQHNSLLISEN